MALAKKKLLALNHFFCGLTPELSRPARCGSGRSETAKRARLERIVRPLKAMLFCSGNPGTESALTRVNPQPTAEA